MNMINRHQGLVDKVQPRTRSMFEPETAPAVAEDNTFTGAADTMVKESRDTGFAQQPVFSKTLIIDESIPDTPPSAPASALFQQAAQTGEDFRINEPTTLDRNRMEVMNEQIQGVLARLGRKQKSQETFSDANELQKSVPSEAAEQTTGKDVSNEMGLASRIDETLSRLKNQTSHAVEGKQGLQDQAHTLSANTGTTEADPLLTLPAHTETTGAGLHNEFINHQAQTVNTPIISQDGAFQIPGWLTELQTELTGRWREINTKSQAEPVPVINVTIGRVEVRAINTEPPKPTPAQGKPKGVLSLDDYLKLRGKTRGGHE
ncbi:MAG: hypothetical protein ACXWT4_07970 [Methylobacter sp.]